MAQNKSVIQRRKLAVYLLFFFTAGWILLMMGVQFYHGYKVGYGTGFGGDSNRVPTMVMEQAKLPPGATMHDAVIATSHKNAPEISTAEDIGRLLLSFALLIGLIYFWYLVMSGLPTF